MYELSVSNRHTHTKEAHQMETTGLAIEELDAEVVEYLPNREVMCAPYCNPCCDPCCISVSVNVCASVCL
jgi:hypothetical protein